MHPGSPQAARETLQHHLAALTRYSCAHRTKNPSISGFRCTNSSVEQCGHLQNNSRWSSKWPAGAIPRPALRLCHNTGEAFGAKWRLPAGCDDPENQHETCEKGMKEGFNPFHWTLADSTCEGLRRVLDVGNEGRPLFCPWPVSFFLRKHCSHTSELSVRSWMGRGGEDTGMKRLL